jgi:hypothetical protein
VSDADAGTFLAEIDKLIADLTADLSNAREFRRVWVSRSEPQGQPAMRSARLSSAAAVKAPRRTAQTWIREALSGGDRLTAADLSRRCLAAGWITDSADPAVVVRNALRRMDDVDVDGDKRYFLTATEPDAGEGS